MFVTYFTTSTNIVSTTIVTNITTPNNTIHYFQVCLAIAIVWILFSVTIFITVTWGSGLCCKVVCCRSSPVEVSLSTWSSSGVY